MTPIDQEIGHLAEELGREGTCTHSRDVSLRDSDHSVDVPRANPAADAGTAGSWIRGGHVWVRAVIEIEEGRLGPLEHDLFAVVQRLVQHVHGVADHWRDAWSELFEIGP